MWVHHVGRWLLLLALAVVHSGGLHALGLQLRVIVGRHLLVLLLETHLRVVDAEVALREVADVVAKYVVLVGLVVGVVVLGRGGDDRVGEASSKVVLLYMMVDYAEASAQALALNLVRLGKLLVLPHHSVGLYLLHAAIDHLRVVVGSIGAVHVAIGNSTIGSTIRIAFLLLLVVELSDEPVAILAPLVSSLILILNFVLVQHGMASNIVCVVALNHEYCASNLDDVVDLEWVKCTYLALCAQPKPRPVCRANILQVEALLLS